MKCYLIVDHLASLQSQFETDGQKENVKVIKSIIKTIRDSSYDSEDPITESARRELFPLLKKAGLTLEQFKQMLHTEYGIRSTKAIPWMFYVQILDKLKKRIEYVQSIPSFQRMQIPLEKNINVNLYQTQGQVHE